MAKIDQLPRRGAGVVLIESQSRISAAPRSLRRWSARPFAFTVSFWIVGVGFIGSSANTSQARRQSMP
jgi:hypothetical protein